MYKKIISMFNSLPPSREEMLIFKAKATDFFQDFWYETLNQRKPYYDCEKLPEGIQIIATYDKKNKSFYAECPHLNDIYTASSTIEGLIESINDLVYYHYDVPRYIARKLPLSYNPPEEQLRRLQVSKVKIPQVKIKVLRVNALARA